jgi:hypothetical protein
MQLSEKVFARALYSVGIFIIYIFIIIGILILYSTMVWQLVFGVQDNFLHLFFGLGVCTIPFVFFSMLLENISDN